MDNRRLLELCLRCFEGLTENEKSELKEIARGRENEIRNAAEKAKVLPDVAYAMMSLGMDESGSFEKDYYNYEKRSREIFSSLSDFFITAEKSGVESMCIIENMGTLLCNPMLPIGCFSSGDVDLFADRRFAAETEKAAKQCGYERISNKGSGFRDEITLRYKNSGVTDKGFKLNINFLPVSRRAINQERYLERILSAKKIPAPSFPSLKILEPTMQLYFAALHISIGHFYVCSPGIRLYCDIDRLIRSCPIDWELLEKYEKEDLSGTRIYLPIYISRLWLGTPVPDSIIKRVKASECANVILDKFVIKTPENLNRFKRLAIDLYSDDTNLICAAIARIFGKSNR